MKTQQQISRGSASLRYGASALPSSCPRVRATCSRPLPPCRFTNLPSPEAPSAQHLKKAQGTPAKVSGGYAVPAKAKPLSPFALELGPLADDEVDIRVTHNGVCHTDIHMRDDDWFISKFPFVPGHEVVGEVIATGAAVTSLKPGMRVGVGWIADSCRSCPACIRGEENICKEGYTGLIVGGRNGGFQAVQRVKADFAYALPDKLDSAVAAPLLCAGITVYAPIKKWVRPGMHVCVLGCGGLGHLALQFASKMGAVVTALDRNKPSDKEAQCLGFGASRYVQMLPDTPASLQGQFDVIINCASGAVSTGPLVDMLANDGTLVQVGIPGDNATMVLPLTGVVFGQKKVVGSIVGGRADMQGMLQFAADKQVAPLIERMPISQINEAFARVQAGKARYRVVLDMTGDPNVYIKQ